MCNGTDGIKSAVRSARKIRDSIRNHSRQLFRVFWVWTENCKGKSSDLDESRTSVPKIHCAILMSISITYHFHIQFVIMNRRKRIKERSFDFTLVHATKSDSVRNIRHHIYSHSDWLVCKEQLQQHTPNIYESQYANAGAWMKRIVCLYTNRTGTNWIRQCCISFVRMLFYIKNPLKYFHGVSVTSSMKWTILAIL